MNRENLQKLADGLRGPLRAEFDMNQYVSCDDLAAGLLDDDAITSVATFAQYHCGTAACAAGHATYLVEPKREGEDFSSYCDRVFSLSSAEDDDGWDWCFGASWDEIDNTPGGAADRIEWMLEHGVPTDSGMQRTGRVPLCYRSTEPQE